jgi:hypothetical protein
VLSAELRALYYSTRFPLEDCFSTLPHAYFCALAADVHTPLILGGGAPETTVAQYLEDNFDYKHSFLGWVAFIMIAYGVTFAFIAVLALQFMKHQKR